MTRSSYPRNMAFLYLPGFILTLKSEAVQNRPQNVDQSAFRNIQSLLADQKTLARQREGSAGWQPSSFVDTLTYFHTRLSTPLPSG
jgi:hypothetical protein